MNLFTQRLKELIITSEKKQKDICEDLGISKQKLSKWKTGYNEPCIDELMILANYFEVSLDYLVGMEDEIGGKKVINSFHNFQNSGNFHL